MDVPHEALYNNFSASRGSNQFSLRHCTVASETREAMCMQLRPPMKLHEPGRNCALRVGTYLHRFSTKRLSAKKVASDCCARESLPCESPAVSPAWKLLLRGKFYRSLTPPSLRQSFRSYAREEYSEDMRTDIFI